MIDVVVGGIGFDRKQAKRRHDLTGLAETALRNIDRNPRTLQGVGRRAADALDRGHALTRDTADGRHAGPPVPAIEMDGACTALCDAAAVFRPGKVEGVAQHPQKRGVGIAVEAGRLASRSVGRTPYFGMGSFKSGSRYPCGKPSDGQVDRKAYHIISNDSRAAKALWLMVARPIATPDATAAAATVSSSGSGESLTTAAGRASRIPHPHPAASHPT